MTSSKQNIYSVSKLNREAKYLLENELGTIWISAELSSFVTPSSGHWYFTLKDDKAQLRCAMFRSNNQSVAFKPRDGDQLLIRGRLSLYEARGDYQLIAETMEPAGAGLLKQQFEKLKLKLASEGLFASHFKQPLPKQISTVGIITSKTGAAVKDILAVAKRRQPSLEFIIYPTAVQGEQATRSIVEQIELANSRNEVDVLIVGRGGGSLEDLWCFNQEAVAKAIFDSKIPLISAVGHEVDFTIADFVADLRAATPSAAAEMVTSNKEELFQRITQQFQRLEKAVHSALKHSYHQAELCYQRLLNLHPERQLQQQQQKLDEITLRMQHALKSNLSSNQATFQRLVSSLQTMNPTASLVGHSNKLQLMEEKLNRALHDKIDNNKNRLLSAAKNLDLVSPLATLGRGYSISFAEEGAVLRSVKQVKSGELITTKVVDGEVISKVQ